MPRPMTAPMPNASRQPMLTGNNPGLQQQEGDTASKGSSDPECGVDQQVHVSANACRDQFVNGGIDSGIFATDAGAGECAEEDEAPEIPRKSGGRCGCEIEDQRDAEQTFAAQQVCEIAEHESAGNGTCQVDGGCDAELSVRETKRVGPLQNADNGPGKVPFKAVQQPGNSQS